MPRGLPPTKQATSNWVAPFALCPIQADLRLAPLRARRFERPPHEGPFLDVDASAVEFRSRPSPSEWHVDIALGQREGGPASSGFQSAYRSFRAR